MSHVSIHVPGNKQWNLTFDTTTRMLTVNISDENVIGQIPKETVSDKSEDKSEDMSGTMPLDNIEIR